MTSASIVVVTHGVEPDLAARAIASAEGQGSDVELVVLGEGTVGLASARVVIPSHAEEPGAARNRAVLASRGELVIVLEGHERLAPGALERHRAAHAATPGVVVTYGQTSCDDGATPRVRPESGKGGRLLARLLQEKHLVAATGAVCARREALGADPFGPTLTTPPALRLSLAVRAAQAGEAAFVPAVVAERGPERQDLTALEELVKVVVGVRFGPEPLDDRLEQRARLRLARQLVAVGKHHHRAGDLTRAGKFFDEAVRAAPGYFKGRRYQFMNFIRRMLPGKT